MKDSHILPEFVFRPTYDTSRTAVLIDLEHERRRKMQKGFTERLLCLECEGRINVWETYFSRVWFHRTHRLRPDRLQEKGIVIKGLCYTRFRLFHLSILWRAGISRLSAFQSVRLGSHEGRIRTLLFEEEPGDPDVYPFFGIAQRVPETNKFQDQLLKAPDASRLDGHRVYVFMFGGVMWCYLVSGNLGSFSMPLTFTKDGTLTLAVQDWNEDPYIQELAKRLAISSKLSNK